MSGIVHEVSVVHIAGTDSDHIERATHEQQPPASDVAWDPSNHLGISRERKIELMQAFEAGKIIEYTTPEGVVWQVWNYLDEAGGSQPQLGDARYPDGTPITWHIPDQEQVVVEYKVGVSVGRGGAPFAVIAPSTEQLHHMQNQENFGREIIVDKDEALIERKITLWVRKVSS